MAGIGMRGPGGGSGDIIPSGYKTGQLSQYTPKQNRIFKGAHEFIKPDSYLSRLAGGDESLFGEMEAPALQQFQGMLGNLSSRFSGGSGRGSLGTRHSSGFGLETTSAMSNFSQQLQAQRQQLQRQALQDLMGYSETLLNQRPYDRILEQQQPKQPKEKSPWGSIAGGLIGGVGGAFLGNPVLGAQLGSAAGHAFF